MQLSDDFGANEVCEVLHVRDVGEALRVTLQSLTEAELTGENVVILRILDRGRNGWLICGLGVNPDKEGGYRPVESRDGNRSERGLVAGRCGDVLKIQANFESCR